MPISSEAPILDAPSGLYDARRILEKSKRNRSYCGPWAAMTITGFSYEGIRAAFNETRGVGATRGVLGIDSNQMRKVLSEFGVTMKEVNPDLENKNWEKVNNKITLTQFLRMRDNEDMDKTYLMICAHHWIIVRGRKVTCSIIRRWTWIKYAAKRRGVITRLFEVSTVDKERARGAKDKYRSILQQAEVDRQSRIKATTTNKTYRAMALDAAKRLNCVAGDYNFDEVLVDAPEGKAFPDGQPFAVYDGWEDAYKNLSGLTTNDFEEYEE